jgi:hypothetical protein
MTAPPSFQRIKSTLLHVIQPFMPKLHIQFVMVSLQTSSSCFDALTSNCFVSSMALVSQEVVSMVIYTIANRRRLHSLTLVATSSN